MAERESIRCASCGYALETSLAAEPCPECGRHVNGAASERQRESRDLSAILRAVRLLRRASLGTALFVMFFTLAIVVHLLVTWLRGASLDALHAAIDWVLLAFMIGTCGTYAAGMVQLACLPRFLVDDHTYGWLPLLGLTGAALSICGGLAFCVLAYFPTHHSGSRLPPLVPVAAALVALTHFLWLRWTVLRLMDHPSARAGARAFLKSTPAIALIALYALAAWRDSRPSAYSGGWPPPTVMFAIGITLFCQERILSKCFRVLSARAQQVSALPTESRLSAAKRAALAGGASA